MKRILPALLPTLLILSVIATFGLHRHTRALFSDLETASDLYYLPPSNWIRAFSIGYTEATANLIWIKAVVYFAETSTNYLKNNPDPKHGRPQKTDTVNYVQAVADLNPKFEKAYTHGAQFILFHQGVITKTAVDAAIELLEKGRRELSSNGQILFDLGFLYYWEIPRVINDKDEITRSRYIGARLIQLSSLMADAPPYAGNLSASLLSDQGHTELVAEHLQTQLFKETNPAIRLSLETQLLHLQGDIAREDIRRATSLFERHQDTYPFIPPDLYTLLVSSEADVHPLDEFYHRSTNTEPVNAETP